MSDWNKFSLPVLLFWLCFYHWNGCLFANAYGFILTNAAGHNEASGDTRTSAISTANTRDEIAEQEEGLFAEDYYPGDGGGDGSTEQIHSSSTKPAAMASVFEYGTYSANSFGETRDFLHFLRRIKYDHRQCPENQGESVEIGVSVVVSNIRAVSEVTMDYSLELFYRESWLDTRLNYDKELFANKTELALHESYANFLWHPDTFMPNAIASKNPQKQSISHRSLLRLREGGRILYSRRISVVAECPMDLTLFPFDSQTCKLGIESYGYTAEQVSYKWSRGQINALTLLKIRLPDFQIREAFVTSQLETYATGNYSRLYVCFVFARASGFCFLQLIIPSTAVVITSWVALWMESETEFQDMISIILAITFLIFSYNEMMPRVSYLKALDIWLAVCFMIVFLSLIKLAIVKYMRQKLRKNAQKDSDQLLTEILPVMCVTPNPSHEHSPLANGYMPSSHATSDQQNGLLSNPAYSSPIFRSNSVQLRSVLVGGAGQENSFTRRLSRLSNQGAAVLSLRPEASSPDMQSVELGQEEGSEQQARQNTFMFATYAKKKDPLKTAVSLWRSSKCTFTYQHMKRFHWVSQMIFFFGFVIFALFYFLVYPHLHIITIDPACRKEKAEWFAEIL
uniref:Uncharacterized protein n=1 Tax=Ditylenchus dipsaci TaxID=166011 RepID=A0A915DVT7_9BILA